MIAHCNLFLVDNVITITQNANGETRKVYSRVFLVRFVCNVSSRYKIFFWFTTCHIHTFCVQRLIYRYISHFVLFQSTATNMVEATTAPIVHDSNSLNPSTGTSHFKKSDMDKLIFLFVAALSLLMVYNLTDGITMEKISIKVLEFLWVSCFASFISSMLFIYWVPYAVLWILFQIVLERILPVHTSAEPDTGTGTSIVPHSPKKRSTWPNRINANGHLALWVTVFVFFIGWPSLKEVTVWKCNGSIVSSSAGILPDEMTTKVVLQFGAFPYWTSIGEYGILMWTITTTGLSVLLSCVNRNIHPLHCGWFYRIGLLTWLSLNIDYGYSQHREMGYNTESMILIQIFHFIHIWDALYYDESAMLLSNIDTECGFRSLFYHLCWIPCTYNLPTRYLVHLNPHLTTVSLSIIVLIYIIGYIMFRYGVDLSKFMMRQNLIDTSSFAQFISNMETKPDMAQNIKCAGDCLRIVSWFLLCGFDSIQPYVYAAIFLMIEVIYNSKQDDGSLKATDQY